MGTVLRGTPRREDGRDLDGPMDSATPLARARRDLSGLPPEDHHGDGVAQPPHRVANPWGQGHDREPRARASELPPADPQPRLRRKVETWGSRVLRRAFERLEPHEW